MASLKVKKTVAIDRERSRVIMPRKRRINHVVMMS